MVLCAIATSFVGLKILRVSCLSHEEEETLYKFKRILLLPKIERQNNGRYSAVSFLLMFQGSSEINELTATLESHNGG
jgi:hypothetical protein